MGAVEPGEVVRVQVVLARKLLRRRAHQLLLPLAKPPNLDVGLTVALPPRGLLPRRLLLPLPSRLGCCPSSSSSCCCGLWRLPLAPTLLLGAPRLFLLLLLLRRFVHRPLLLLLLLLLLRLLSLLLLSLLLLLLLLLLLVLLHPRRRRQGSGCLRINLARTPLALLLACCWHPCRRHHHIATQLVVTATAARARAGAGSTSRSQGGGQVGRRAVRAARLRRACACARPPRAPQQQHPPYTHTMLLRASPALQPGLEPRAQRRLGRGGPRLARALDAAL